MRDEIRDRFERLENSVYQINRHTEGLKSGILEIRDEVKRIRGNNDSVIKDFDRMVDRSLSDVWSNVVVGEVKPCDYDLIKEKFVDIRGRLVGLLPRV